jgi:hypothetical protein
MKAKFGSSEKRKTSDEMKFFMTRGYSLSDHKKE